MQHFLSQADYLTNIAIFSGLTIFCFYGFVKMQAKTQWIWLNPMLFAVVSLMGILYFLNIDYKDYQHGTTWLSKLLEPAVVALGYPLYLQLATIKRHWKSIALILTFGAGFVISLSYIMTLLATGNEALSVSIALKSVTTPIGLALTNELNGNQAVTAFAIIIAGLVGAVKGVDMLEKIGCHDAKAQGLAIGAASHALGTSAMSQLSHVHTAYSSLALIFSATITAIIAPAVIPLLTSLF